MRMRTAALLLGVLALAGLGLVALLTGDRGGLGDVPQAPGGLVENEAGESEGGPLSPVGDWLYAQRSGRDAVRSARAYELAKEQAQEVRAQTREMAPALADAVWAHIAPKELGGRVSEVAAHPTTPDVVYAATASGGVWKSSDGGLAWKPSWPAERTQAIGGLAVASDGTLFAGTGEPTPAGGYVVSSGSGIYRSADGGATWIPVGLEGSGAVGRIVTNPSGSIFVAAAGHLLRPGGERGLYRSGDRGESWELVLAGENDTTGAIDVAIDTGRGQNLLAAMWDRDVVEKRLTGPGSGVYRSADGGDTWERVSLPGNVAPEQVGRIGVAFAPSSPSRAYAVVSNDARGRAVGLWRSDDGGRTWAKTRASARSLDQAGYGWWFGRVFVDPRDRDRLFVAGLRINESTDGGDSFVAHGVAGGAVQPAGARAPVVANNQHAMVWDPTRPGRVYLGNDGGIFRSGGDAHTETWVPATSQGWTQHYSVAGSSWTASVPRATGSVAPAAEDGPGSFTIVVPAPSDPHVIYAATPRGSLFRTVNGGGDWTRLEEGNDDPMEDVSAAIAVHPSDPDEVFAAFTDRRGSSRVIKTSDGGSSWSDISANLPEAPVNDAVVLRDGTLTVASDVGVFVERGSTWLSVGSNLPAVPVLEIDLDLERGRLTAATFGRGILRVSLP
jgi:photosystem II stability/assembly factor-like uncharacterized protein